MLIGVTGSKGSGKDRFGEYFLPEFTNVRQAGPLKAMLTTMYQHAGLTADAIEARLEGDLKEISCAALGGATPRRAMQTLGTEWRNMIDKHLWLNIWRQRVEILLANGLPVICTDIRFKHEAEAIDDLGGVMVRVERPGFGGEDGHPSETEMRDIYARYTIMNEGTIEDLHKKAETLLRSLA